MTDIQTPSTMDDRELSVSGMLQLWDDDAKDIQYETTQQESHMFEDPNALDQSSHMESLMNSPNYMDWTQEFDSTMHRFNLRPGVRTEFGRAYMTDVDRDETGNYDPRLENRRRKKSNNKRRLQTVPEDDEIEDQGVGTELDMIDSNLRFLTEFWNQEQSPDNNVPRQTISAVSNTTRSSAGPLRPTALLRNRMPSGDRAARESRRWYLTPRPYQHPLQTIRTKFCHPMVFNYDDFEGDDQCHFCMTAEASILGLQQRRPVVRVLPDGRGYAEVSNGHAAEGTRNTKVCSMCTFQRMQIIACPRHEMRRIERWNPISFKTAIEELRSGQNKQTWCSVCCNLAKWVCCVAQDDDSPNATGCGLVLCEGCSVVLDAFEGDLDKMLHEIKDDCSRLRPLGLRADACLLKKDGLLMRFIMDDTESI